MKINTKTRYGLRAMIEIALQKDNRGILQKDIAKNQGISEKYLDQIIPVLKTAGFITNVAGKRSGYMLVQSSREITILDIYKAFNREVALVDCLEEGKDCRKQGCCAANDFWRELNACIEEKMNSVSLSELTEKQKDLYDRDEPILYHI